MKTHQFFIALLFSVYTNAQFTIHDYEYPNGAYLQDTNNELDFYVGNWQGIQNNKKYIFIFVKYLHNLHGSVNNEYHYEDDIYVKLKVIDLNTNQTLYDDTSISLPNEFKILQVGIRNNSSSYWYNDKTFCQDTFPCGLDAEFKINKITNNNNQIKYCYFRYGEWFFPGNSSYSNADQVPMFLPKEDLILTRQ